MEPGRTKDPEKTPVTVPKPTQQGSDGWGLKGLLDLSAPLDTHYTLLFLPSDMGLATVHLWPVRCHVSDGLITSSIPSLRRTSQYLLSPAPCWQWYQLKGPFHHNPVMHHGAKRLPLGSRWLIEPLAKTTLRLRLQSKCAYCPMEPELVHSINTLDIKTIVPGPRLRYRISKHQIAFNEMRHVYVI